jgi:hypothetical protein
MRSVLIKRMIRMVVAGVREKMVGIGRSVSSVWKKAPIRMRVLKERLE